MRFVFPLLFLLTVLPDLSALQAQTFGGVRVWFDDKAPGQILPRRSHQTLAVSSYNIRSLDATILHAPESDVLAELTSRPSEDGESKQVPPEAREVWHGQVQVSAPDGTAVKPDQKNVTAIDVLKLVPNLQPGFYYLAVKSGEQAKAVRPFTISNLGIQAFSGADGLAAVVRLLSEAKPAQNVEVALIAKNNRELGRVRTGADGVARFSQEAGASPGEDAPAALYAYGADGEFSALNLAAGDILDAGDKDASLPTFPTAWVATDKRHYDPGQPIHGIAILRQADGKDVAGTATANLVMEDGRILEQQSLTRHGGGVRDFTLHAPADTAWHIRIEDAQSQTLANYHIEAMLPKTDATAASSPPSSASIQLGAGRRTFQRGEIANISVQPPETSEITLAVIDSSVHAIVTQHIDKTGGVVQIPLPQDAGGGVYLFASGTTPAPDDPNGQPLHRSFGLQWLDIDQGTHRFGVRIDVPDSITAGNDLPVHVTVPDDQTGKADFAIIGTAADAPSGIDPIARFYGRHPSTVRIFSGYSVIQPFPAEAMPDLSQLMLSDFVQPAPILLWSGVQDTPTSNTASLVPVPAAAKPGRVRLSVVAASGEAIGFAESGVDVKPGTPARTVKPKPPAKAVPGKIAPHGKVTVPAHGMVIASAAPIVAAPLWIGADNVPHYSTPSDPDELQLMRELAGEIPQQNLIEDVLLAEALNLPGFAREAARGQLLTALRKPAFNADDSAMALYALYHEGEAPLWAQSWLGTPLPETASWLAHLCRYGLTRSEADRQAIPAEETSDDLATQLLIVRMTQLADANDRKVILPAGLLDDVARQAFKPGLDWRARLSLRVIQAGLANGPALRPEWTDPPLLSKATTRMPVLNADAKSADKRPLFILTLTNWPAQAPE